MLTKLNLKIGLTDPDRWYLLNDIFYEQASRQILIYTMDQITHIIDRHQSPVWMATRNNLRENNHNAH